MPHYQDIAFQASGENDYITLAGMERAASPQPEVYENPLVLPTTGSEREQMRRADRRTSHSEENEEESTIHSSEDVSRQRSQTALHLSSQPITRETGHVSNDLAKQPGAVQERNIRTVFGCLLLFCLLISVGSGVLAGLAFSRASSSSGGYNQLHQASSLLSMSSSTTSGSKGCICSDGSLDAEINNSVPVRTLSQNLKRMLAEVEELQSHDHHRSMAMLRSELQALQEKVVDEQIFQKSELLRYHTSLSVDVNRSMAMLRSELQELQGKVAIEQTDLKAYLLRNHASLAESLNRNGTTLRSELQELQSKMASELQKLQIKSTSELQTLQSETTSELQKLQSKTTREQTKLKSQLLRDHASLTNDVTEAKSTLTKLKTRFDVSERQRTTNISSLQKVCRGIVAWKYYAWRNWSSEVDVGLLRAVQYDKQRQDTILRVSFYSTFGQYHKRSCGQWVIKFNHSNCIEPAPIVSLIYTAERPDHMWHIAPAEIGGFCKSTSSGTIGPGKVAITVLVQQCGQNVENNAHTGRPTGVGEATSSLLVEEYCPNESP